MVYFQARVLNKDQVKVDSRAHRHWKLTENTRRLNYNESVFLSIVLTMILILLKNILIMLS